MTRARDNSFNPFNNQAAGKNIIINGGFDIWQRNTSFTGITAGNTYVADRWTTGTAGSYNIYVSRQPTGDIVNVPDIQYCLRFGRTSGTSGANWNTLNTSIETANSVPFAGKKITLSFYARAGANFSSSGNTLASFLLSGTGVDQNVAVSYTGQLYSYGGHTLTTSWQRFTNTYTVPTNATELSISLQYVPTGTAAANDYYEVTGVQLEIGSSATVFSRAGGTIGGELLLCQRYYYTTTMNKHLGDGRDSGLAFLSKDFPIQMRTIPSFSSNVTTKVANGIFPGTAGQVGFYGDGWIAANGATLACAGDGQTADTGAFYIQGFAITTGKIFSLQTENLTSFNWAAEL